MGPFSAGYERVIISSEALRLTADLAPKWHRSYCTFVLVLLCLAAFSLRSKGLQVIV